jgi:hypothetical protein
MILSRRFKNLRFVDNAGRYCIISGNILRGNMAKKKTTMIYIDEDLLERLRTGSIKWGKSKGGIRDDGRAFSRNDFIIEAIEEKLKSLDTLLDK